MTYRPLLCSILLTAALLVDSGLAAIAAGQSANGFTAHTLTLGIVAASHQREIEEHFRPFVTYIARRLFPTGDAEGKVIIASSLPELAKALDQRKIDFFMESPYPTYVVNQVHGAGKLLLRRWKGGLAEYRGLIVTSKDSGVNRLENLRGRVIAFEDPESTSGYFLPKFFLQRNGFKLSQVAVPDAPVPASEVGYIFATDNDKLFALIFARQVAAGAISDDDLASLDDKGKVNLNVLAQTELLPRHLVSVRKDLDAESCEGLARVLQTMHENEEGRKILLDADNTTKFDLLPGGDEVMRRRLLDTFYAVQRR